MPQPETAAPPSAGEQAHQRLVDVGIVKSEAVRLADRAWNLGVEWGIRVIGVIILLVAAWMLAAWARRTLYRGLNKPQFDQTLIRFLSNFLRWAILTMGVVAALTIFGIAPASLAAVVGATGLAVGLAMQGSLSNLAAGIMLLILRPFKVGESITVAGFTGVVDEIELFYTKLDTADRRRVMIPNSAVFGAPIDNSTHHAVRRAEVLVTVAAGSSIEQTRAALQGAITRIAGILPEPAAEVALVDLVQVGAGGLVWAVRVWVSTSRLGSVREALVQAVKESLDAAGIGFPTAAAAAPVKPA
jgi:small conductance mechanosensitive channel